mgnify:FL=1
MVSVLQVYTALRDLANKEQKGFITPQVFNSFAALAQMNIYNEMFAELVTAKRLSRQNFEPGRDKSVRKQKQEDLAFYLRRKAALLDLEYNNGLLEKPSDLSKIVSIYAGSLFDPQGATNANQDLVNCELVYDPEKIDRIVGSNLSYPTESFPVALVSAVDIEIFPPTIPVVYLNYYAKPTSFDSEGNILPDAPYYDFRTASYNGESLEVFNAQGSRNFMLPPHYLTEVVMELAKLIGIRLRETQVSVFASREEASE